MRKADFDWKTSEHGFNEDEYRQISSEIRAYEKILKSHPGIITSYWVGVRDKRPYIMVTVETGKVKEPEKLLPDRLGKYEVYFIEGKFHL